jgi:3'(2'), 5'-bisphosphate nucleotidase
MRRNHLEYDKEAMTDFKALIDAVLPIVARAGEAIMSVYEGEFAVERKDDNSPLTKADLESQRIILQGLAEVTPEMPVLSEESAHAPWMERRSWPALWLVDPLDGTREFVKRNGEFTVNIALIADHEPVLGFIGVPAQRVSYWGAKGIGAFVHRPGSQVRQIRVSDPATPLRVAGSRSHTTPQTARYLEKLDSYVLQSIGSSIKFCLIAEGKADLYARFGPTSEWDTAAGQAILEAAGGHVTRLDGHRLRYNCRESLINGDFVAFNDPRVLPRV